MNFSANESTLAQTAPTKSGFLHPIVLLKIRITKDAQGNFILQNAYKKANDKYTVYGGSNPGSPLSSSGRNPSRC